MTPALTRFSASCITSPKRSRHEVAAHRGDDAERAAMVAALADLEIRIVRGRELDPLRGHEVHEGIVRPGQVRVHRAHHLRGRVRSGDREHPGMRLAHEVAATLGAEAARDDDLAVLGQRLADGVERLRHGGIDEPAGIDHHEVGAAVIGRDRIAFRAQLGEDLLGIDERLGAAERHEAHARRGRGGSGEFWGHGGDRGQCAGVPSLMARQQAARVTVEPDRNAALPRLRDAATRSANPPMLRCVPRASACARRRRR